MPRLRSSVLTTIKVRLQVGPELPAEKFIAPGAGAPPPTALPRIPQKRR